MRSWGHVAFLACLTLKWLTSCAVAQQITCYAPPCKNMGEKMTDEDEAILQSNRQKRSVDLDTGLDFLTDENPHRSKRYAGLGEQSLSDDPYFRFRREFYRFGRNYQPYQDKRFLRFGRNYQPYQDKRFLRFGRSDQPSVDELFLQAKDPFDRRDLPNEYDAFFPSYRKKRSADMGLEGATQQGHRSRRSAELTDEAIEGANSEEKSKDLEKRDASDLEEEKRFMRFGRAQADKRFMRFGKRFMRFGKDVGLNQKRFMRFGRDPSEEKRFMRFGKKSGMDNDDNVFYNEFDDDSDEDVGKRFMRFGKRFMRFGKREGEDEKRFMRFGKREGEDKRFMRFGKREGEDEKRFMRFGKREGEDEKRFMRFGKRDMDKRFMRFGKSLNHEDEKRFMRFGKRFMRFGKRDTRSADGVQGNNSEELGQKS